MERAWADVDGWFENALVRDDVRVDDEGLPPHAVSPLQGKLLALIVAMTNAKRILEIGTLAGYSTIWLARHAERVVSLEANERHAGVARRNIERAGFAAKVDVLVGPALETLPSLGGPFDLVFIDADKKNNAAYLAHALRLSRAGTVIVVDNVVRDGAVVDASSTDENVLGVRALVDALSADPRVESTAIQTVGTKGWDGFVLARVR